VLPPDPLAAALLESDRAYFELAAATLPHEGAVIASMVGLEALAGAVVVQRVEEHAVSDPTAWVRDLDDRLRAEGAVMARVYLGPRPPGPAPLPAALAAAGHRRRVEIGYLAPAATAAGSDGVTLRRVDDEAGWEEKHKLHAGSEVASDGHVSPAGDWVELERRKCATGGMEAFLIESRGEVCGAVGTLTMADQGLLRAKNVFVRPESRRRGIASATIRALCARARSQGLDAVGIFGVEGNPGNAVYMSLAMTPTVRQMEWSLPLDPGRR